MKHTIDIEEEQRQVLLLAIAELALSRPGWDWMLGELSETLHGREMFGNLKKTNADRVRAERDPLEGNQLRGVALSAWNALKSYQYGNTAPDLAGEICAALERVLQIDPERPPAIERLVEPANRADADPFEHPDVKAFFQRAESELFPRMKESAASITIFGKPDPKLCMELGAALLFDKPIIVMVPDGRGPVPANLKRCASAIVEGSMDDPTLQKRLQDALKGVLKHDRRAQ